MINHVVILTLSRRVTSLERVNILNAAHNMKEGMPFIRSLECGFDAGIAGDENSSFSLTAKFDSKGCYLEYAKHPLHLNFIEKHIKPILAVDGRRAIQYEA